MAKGLAEVRPMLPEPCTLAWQRLRALFARLEAASMGRATMSSQTLALAWERCSRASQAPSTALPLPLPAPPMAAEADPHGPEQLQPQPAEPAATHRRLRRKASAPAASSSTTSASGLEHFSSSRASAASSSAAPAPTTTLPIPERTLQRLTSASDAAPRPTPIEEPTSSGPCRPTPTR